MALDGILLHQLNGNIKEQLPLKINKFAQPTESDIVIFCYGKKRFKLLISTHSVYNRCQFTLQETPNFSEPSHFLLLLRKHLESGILQDVEQIGLDRILKFTITNRDEMGVLRTFYMMVELMGKYANIILVDEEQTILDAIKRIPPFENSKRIIFSGAPYILPVLEDKQDPRKMTHIDAEKSLVVQFYGFSPLLAKEFVYRMTSGEQFSDLVDEAFSSQTLYLYPEQKQDIFHLIELKHLQETPLVYPLMEGLDRVYFEKEQADRIAQHTGGLLKVIQREIKKLRQKLPRLEQALAEAQDNQQWQTYGDLLYSFGQNVPSGNTTVTLNDYENQPIIIPLDKRFNGKENARRYYAKYRKGKTGQVHITGQIEITMEQLQYFEGLKTQCEQADVEDAQEIARELAGLRLFKVNQREKTGKKKKRPNFIEIHWNDNTTIFIGKNNLQNDYLTFKFAMKNDWWFHATDTFGAHVIIKTTQTLDEALIRFVANCAAYYSSSRHSSSVPVSYTQIKHIKKIPGKPPGFVAMKEYQTIYIDPDLGLIQDHLK